MHFISFFFPSRLLLQRQDAWDSDGSDEQPLRVSPAVVHSLPHVPGKWSQIVCLSLPIYLQSNPFYPFGESYAGKFVPSLTRHIHERNQEGNDKIQWAKIVISIKDYNGSIHVCFARINLAGMGIGDGWMSPYHNARYAKFLYQVLLFLDSLQYSAEIWC